MKKIAIISSSLRTNSNSEILCKKCFEKLEKTNEVTYISLKNKNISFCVGCLKCQETGKCILKDDTLEILNKVKESDVIIFGTPLYYYGISGQLKTLLDRLNPLYDTDYKFKDIYLIVTAAENENETFNEVVNQLNGWVDCFERATLQDTLMLGGLETSNDALKIKDLDEIITRFVEKIK